MKIIKEDKGMCGELTDRREVSLYDALYYVQREIEDSRSGELEKIKDKLNLIFDLMLPVLASRPDECIEETLNTLNHSGNYKFTAIED